MLFTTHHNSQETVNDLPVGRSVDETLRLLKALQFVVCPAINRNSTGSSNGITQDKYGEVCPANWSEGGKTMKADPKASLHYFESVATKGSAETNGKKRSGVEMQVDGPIDGAKKAKI